MKIKNKKMNILLLGDTHGNWFWMDQNIKYAKTFVDIDLVIQLGDFGCYHSNIKELVNNYKKFTDCPIYFIDGNHEDHFYLRYECDLTHMNDRCIFYQPRGSIIELDGRTIGFMGGAFNVDRPQEILEDMANFPTNNEIEKFSNTLNDLNKPTDLLVTHGCPGGIGIGTTGISCFQSTYIKFVLNEGLASKQYSIYDIGEEPLTKLWLSMNHKPKNWTFGHYHQSVNNTIDNCAFYGIDKGDSFNNVAFIYNTETNTIQSFNIKDRLDSQRRNV